MKALKSKGFLLLILILNFHFVGKSQILTPVKWSFSSEITAPGEANLVLTATIDKKWHLYSQNIPAGGPIPTSFTFTVNKDFQLWGKVSEPKPIEEFDPNFDMKLKFFANKAVFKQKIKILSKKDFVVKGSLEFMCCDDKQCLPPETVEFEIPVKSDGSVTPAVVPANETVKDTSKTSADSLQKAASDTTQLATITDEEDLGNNVTDKSLFWIFIMGFLGGLIALLTPCVWPMIPMTVSFFLKRASKRRKAIRDAITYGLAIIVIYVGLGLGVTLIFGADALNALSTSAVFNLIFFALLVIFAISFFGAFELTLPSKWTNAMDRKADSTSGIISIFFMAFTLALVSFSCTGPIIGTLLVDAVTKGAMAPLLGMSGFALALAIPFSLFAVFPAWLNKLPKSGGWMNTVKVVLGFLELALALKFLSVADLAYHWGILDREVFLVLWIVIFGLLGIYLLGWLRFPHDDEQKHVGVFKLFLAIISLAFAIYMVPGLWGAPLKAISAFSPPQYTQDFDLNTETVHAMFDDYDIGMDYAKKVGKPVIVDFTGYGCVNCRNMEVSVWVDPKVSKLLTQDYVLISLYVDDKTSLPESEQKTVEFGGKTRKLKTVGNKWSHLQASRFGTNSQPYYVLLDNDGNLLAKPRAYDLDVDKFVRFLENGLKRYKARTEQKVSQ